MPNNPYPAWMRERCVHCEAGWPISADRSLGRFHAIAAGASARCTAPTAEERITELEAALKPFAELSRHRKLRSHGGIKTQRPRLFFGVRRNKLATVYATRKAALLAIQTTMRRRKAEYPEEEPWLKLWTVRLAPPRRKDAK